MKRKRLSNARLFCIITLLAICSINIGAVTYNKVTDASTLSSGDKIIIVNEDGYALSTTQNDNNRGQQIVTITSNTITDPNANVQVITLGRAAHSTDGNTYWTLVVGTNQWLYAASSSKNYLRTQTTLNDNGKWTISISSGNATITAKGSNTRNLLQYNSSNSIFSCYSSSQKTVQIYKQASSCSNSVTIQKGSSINGTFSLNKSGAQTSCDGVTVTVTTSPITGYYTSAVTESGASASPTITGSGNSWTVTYAANTTGTSTISVTFVEKTKYTVTWYVEGEALTGLATGLTSVYTGEKVSALPSPNPTSTCDGEFVGWIKAPAGVVDKTPGDDYETTPSTFNTQGTSPTITGDTDFYAVFKKRKE